MPCPVEMKFQKTWRRRWAVKRAWILALFPLVSGPGEACPPKCMFLTLSLFGLLECNPHRNRKLVMEYRMSH